MAAANIPKHVQDQAVKMLAPVFEPFIRRKVDPNYVTTVGFLVTISAGIAFFLGHVRIGGFLVLLGGFMLFAALNQWRVSDFGRLDYSATMRVVVPGVTLAVLGYQTMLSFFLMSLLEMRRR